jgi:hypothetical protein
MALSLTQDVTGEFNAGNGYTADMSGWDTIVAQFVNPSGTISIAATNDGGAVTGSIEGSGLTAINFQTVQGTKLSDGTAVTSVAAAGLFKVGVVGRYVRFGGASAAATKVIVEFSKIM